MTSLISIPICIDVHDAENRNKEVSTLIDTIMKYPDRFENVIIVGNRCYFSYKLVHEVLRQI